jgi:hypothetical protein
LLEGTIAEYEKLCDAISEVLDSMYTAEIPKGMHMEDLV